MIPVTEQRRANRQLHSIADKIDAFMVEFRDEATKGTGIDELVEQAKALLEDAAARTPLMGLTPAEQAKLAKALNTAQARSRERSCS
jgi:hypothetical protein